MKKVRGENQEADPSRVDNFNWLLRNMVNKTNTNRSETKREKGRVTDGSQQVEIIRWILKID